MSEEEKAPREIIVTKKWRFDVDEWQETFAKDLGENPTDEDLKEWVLEAIDDQWMIDGADSITTVIKYV